MSLTVREIEWRQDKLGLRPVAMPSVLCPCVFDWATKKRRPEWMSVSRCLGCAHACQIKIENNERRGEILCSAGKEE